MAFIILFLLMNFESEGQNSLQVLDLNNNVISGQTIDIWYDVNSQVVSQDFNIKFVGTSSKRIMAKRNVLSYVSGTDNLFCWVFCYSANTNSSPTALLMNQNDVHIFVSHYFNYGLVGTTTINYTLYDTLNTTDSVNFIVKWHVTPTGIHENNSSVRSLSDPFPNPTSSSVSFQLTATSTSSNESDLVITNAIGVEVTRIPVPGLTSKLTIDTQTLENGIYFCRLEGQSDLKKLVVAH